MVSASIAWMCRKRVKKGRQIDFEENILKVDPADYDGIPLSEIHGKNKNGQDTP